jgi:type I restriction enzyme M protein
MITGELKSKVDAIWNAMWSGGIANPMQVVEQLTYLLFIKRLDELHTLREKKASRLGIAIEDPVFPHGPNPATTSGTPAQDLRWSRFRDLAPESLFYLVRDEVFPFIKNLGGAESRYTSHMKEALFIMPTPRLLANVIDRLDELPMHDRDLKGDVYEYMLGKIASAGQNGQFRTPRHIIDLMVKMTAPTPADVICDPACGTCGFLVAAGEYLRENHQAEIFADEAARKRFSEDIFHGFDFDSTMLRIGSMNMMLHGIESPDVRYKDTLEEAHADDSGAYSLILANPPFAGSLDYEATAKDLLRVVKTKKTELLFLALFLRLLRVGGRAAVIVPDGVLFGSSKAHKDLRKTLVEDQKLDGIISMPSGVFKPYAGVSTAILLFTKTNSGGTENVWFYDMQADGFSLDDKRTEQETSDLPDILQRWQNRDAEGDRARIEQSFLVPKSEIADNEYDLSINRYKEIEYEEVEYDPPQEILRDLRQLEEDITEGIQKLEEMVG